MPYIDMYVETRAKEEENIAENYYKKALVSEEAKQKLREDLVKEYKEVLEKIEQANKGRTLKEKIDKLIK
jgi:tryptophanyl-tRNA synthetase